jgi:hypothetical protein
LEVGQRFDISLTKILSLIRKMHNSKFSFPEPNLSNLLKLSENIKKRNHSVGINVDFKLQCMDNMSTVPYGRPIKKYAQTSQSAEFLHIFHNCMIP